MADESDHRDPAFERTLERLFAQPHAFADSDAFAAGVQGRLTRNWRMRTVGIGAAGVFGGLIAATQIVGSGFALKIQQASANSAQAAGAAYKQAWLGLDALGTVSPTAALFWVVSGVVILAAVVGATRVLDEA
jgi:hypothetical protein